MPSRSCPLAGMAAFPEIVIHAGQFRNVREMAGLDVLVVGPGNSGADLLGHLAGSDAGRLWLSARSGMNITPLWLGGVPLHPISVLGRHRPVRRPAGLVHRWHQLRSGCRHLRDRLPPRTRTDRRAPGHAERPRHAVIHRARASPQHPGLWFFGLDPSIHGNMHVRRRQARQLAQAIRRQSAARERSVRTAHKSAGGTLLS